MKRIASVEAREPQRVCIEASSFEITELELVGRHLYDRDRGGVDRASEHYAADTGQNQSLDFHVKHLSFFCLREEPPLHRHWPPHKAIQQGDEGGR